MDEDACYTWLVDLLHPGGLVCPRCGQSDRLGVHRRPRAPVLDYQCGHCRRVFNAWIGTALQGVQRGPSQIILILRGIAQGVPTAQLARELGCDRMHLLGLRHRLQEHEVWVSDLVFDFRLDPCHELLEFERPVGDGLALTRSSKPVFDTTYYRRRTSR